MKGRKRKQRLINEFSWSFSRHTIFCECQKKYWYTYYGSWEGWMIFKSLSSSHGDKFSAYLYAMKNMQSIPMFVGSLVHRTIEEALKNVQQHRIPITLESLLKKGFASLKDGIDEAKSGVWRKAPKKYLNLFEVYHTNELCDDDVAKAEEKVRNCLTNWFNSPIAQDLITAPQATWLSIEELEKFYLDDVYKVWVVIDFAIKWKRKRGTNSVILFDWKTGAKTDLTVDQLYSYALFVSKVWNVAIDDIILTPYYLNTDIYEKIGKGQECVISQERLNKTEEFIRSSCKNMVEKLVGKNIGDNNADVENFPYAENRRRCDRCQFVELCRAANYEELGDSALRAIVERQLYWEE